MMKFISQTNTLILDKEKEKITLNNVQFNMDKIYVFNEKEIKIDFDKYTVNYKDNLLILLDIIEDIVDTLYLEDILPQEDILPKEDKDVYIIKKDVFVSINKSKTTIYLQDAEFSIKFRKKIGTSDCYTCNAGTLELSHTNNRACRWNGITISKLKK